MVFLEMLLINRSECMVTRPVNHIYVIPTCINVSHPYHIIIIIIASYVFPCNENINETCS